MTCMTVGKVHSQEQPVLSETVILRHCIIRRRRKKKLSCLIGDLTYGLLPLLSPYSTVLRPMEINSVCYTYYGNRGLNRKEIIIIPIVQ